MLPPGHIAAGYLATKLFLGVVKPELNTTQTDQLLMWGMFFAFAPDLDMFYAFWKVKGLKHTGKTFNHRQQTITVVNTDRLLDSFLNDSKSGYEILGAKTGSLVEAGYCFAVKLKKENQPITIVSLGSATSFDRFQEIKGLASWIYENYQWPKEGYSNLN